LWSILDRPAEAYDPALCVYDTKDKAGDFMNLNEDDTDNFQEVFVRGISLDEGLYLKKSS